MGIRQIPSIIFTRADKLVKAVILIFVIVRARRNKILRKGLKMKKKGDKEDEKKIKENEK